MRIRYASILLLATLTGSGSAQAAGINLSWNDCGTLGQRYETFACNTNSGIQSMVASFVSPFPFTQVTGVEATLDILFNMPANPSWWSFQTGGCRPNGMFVSGTFTSGPFSCVDLWGDGSVAAALYQPSTPAPDRMRIRGLVAVPAPLVVDNVSEYYAIRFALTHTKTVGAGACAGCDQPACILLTQIKIVQSPGAGDYVVSNPLHSTLVGWQCPVFPGAPSPQCFACSVHGKKGSWGTLKGLYR